MGRWVGMSDATSRPMRPIVIPRDVVFPVLVCLGIVGAMVIAMRAQDRVWFCKCGTIKVWSQDVWSSHCSQHLLDPYSITHFSHGLLFFVGLLVVARRVPLMWRLVIAVFFAAAWEVVENSDFIINRYREVTMSLEYMGDSIVNSVGDVLCCAAGFFVAHKVGWKWALGIFAMTEVVLLFMIRDNLTLNVIMLIKPVDAIKQWQMSGQNVLPVVPTR